MSQHPRQADLRALVEALVGAGVEFIVVGGGAAVLQGAPTTTLDLDIVHRRLRPDASLLMGQGQIRLSTDLGPLDPLCRLHDGRGYEELLVHSEVVTDGQIQIRVIDLPTLIEIKSTTGRSKDKLIVPVLLALLAERTSEPGREPK
ncbi:hypothetical protein [Hyalangium sp.]|uniref:hypothetical protein n=1 Tax=Hyalangium sp. TaxID=2028555 RepID=UPI002D76D3D3|nr:hypothetical protein [Hyalangium sp.]